MYDSTAESDHHRRSNSTSSSQTDHHDDYDCGRKITFKRQGTHGHDSNSYESDQYNFIGCDVQTDEADITPSPTYRFPGTWEVAYHDVSHAVQEVAVVSTTFAKAIRKSGVAKAGFSISSALTATANRTALTITNYATKKSSTNQNRLPSAVKTWLKGKEKLDAAKKRAEEAGKVRLARKIKQELIERREVDESALPSRATSRASSRGEQRNLGGNYSSVERRDRRLSIVSNPWGSNSLDSGTHSQFVGDGFRQQSVAMDSHSRPPLVVEDCPYVDSDEEQGLLG